ncbi:MAG: gamma-glutamyl-gamma-aminobutyrate hydrolase family protein [Kiritimatiellae bacterium]|nr:gamma-glutamyl-gamma-aminobutyrate hydrolase family protein [Kiritimatiellia bacterium]
MKVMSFSSVCAAAMLALSCVAVEARPLIVGMTEQWLGGEEGREKSPRAGVEEAYAEAIRRGGNIPVVICRTAETGHLAQVLAPLDILILTGGADVEPSRYGAEPSPKLGKVQKDRDAFDFAILEAALARKLPVMGICRGMQVINVHFGGTLWQDLPSEFPVKEVRHGGNAVDKRCHTIGIEPDSRLAAVIGATNVAVNSRHHQAVKRLASGFRIVARAPDGVVEAIEHTSLPVAGVQFHPEGLVKYADDEIFMRFFLNLPTFIGHVPKLISPKAVD